MRARFAIADEIRLYLSLGAMGFGFIALTLYSHVEAHSFYDPWCCSGQDCAPTAKGNVSWTPQGWDVKPLQTIVPFNDDRIRHNPPDVPGFSICEFPKGNLRCLYVPAPEG